MTNSLVNQAAKLAGLDWDTSFSKDSQQLALPLLDASPQIRNITYPSSQYSQLLHQEATLGA